MSPVAVQILADQSVPAAALGAEARDVLGMWAVLAGWWFLGLVGIAGSAACSGVEMGLYALNRVRLNLRALRSPPDHAARMLKGEIEHPARLVTTLLIGNNIFHSLCTTASAALIARAGLSDLGAVGVNFLIVAPVLLVLGESLPKELFRVEADRITYWFVRPLLFFRVVLTAIGVLPLVMACSRWAARAAGLTGEPGAGDDPRLRMVALIREGALSGSLTPTQTSLVDRALAMRDITVEAEMVPWDRVRFVRADWDHDRVRRFVADQPRSRLPVVDRSGNVVGVLRQVDLHVQPGAAIDPMLVRPARLTPGIPLLDALRLVLNSPARMGIVERGGRAIGLVTAKDLAEPLTGALPDW